jgi:hypothetical protein
LLETIRTCETVHQEVEDWLSKQICGLGDKVAKYQKTYDQVPNRYVENMHFLSLKVPIGAGFYLLVKWIKRLDTGDVSCFTAQDGPRDPPHFIPIYTSPTASDNTPSRLLPHWFHTVLTGPNPQSLIMLEHAHCFEDWGVVVELDHF